MFRVELILGKVGVLLGFLIGNSWYVCIIIMRMVYLYKGYNEGVWVVKENELV